MRQVVPEEDFGADVLVGMSAVGQRFVGITLPRLINELAELPHRVVLVLDDHQFVTGEDSHNSVAFFADHIPENIHLVISSRPAIAPGADQGQGRDERDPHRATHLDDVCPA